MSIKFILWRNHTNSADRIPLCWPLRIHWQSVDRSGRILSKRGFCHSPTFWLSLAGHFPHAFTSFPNKLLPRWLGHFRPVSDNCWCSVRHFLPLEAQINCSAFQRILWSNKLEFESIKVLSIQIQVLPSVGSPSTQSLWLSGKTTIGRLKIKLTYFSLTGERLVAICYPFSLRPYFHRNAVVKKGILTSRFSSYFSIQIWFIIFLWVISFFPSLYIGLQVRSMPEVSIYVNFSSQ